MIVPLEKADSLVLEREEMRVNLVRNYFAGKSDSTRIRILDYNKDDVLNIGSRPKLMVKVLLAEDMEE